MFKKVKELISRIKERKNEAVNKGDLFKANEIQTNLLSSGTIAALEIAILLCAILNELNVFHLPKQLPRITVVLSLLIDIPLAILNEKTKGESPWMKYALIWGNLLLISLITILCGYYSQIIFLLPLILSIRYCDKRFTKRVFIGTLICCVLAFMLNAVLGDVDLNVYDADRANIFLNLEEALYIEKIDKTTYIYYSFIFDCLPALICITVTGLACVRIAGNGKEMIELQDEITRKNTRIDTELLLAIELQQDMLPSIYPAFPNHTNLDLFAINRPAKEMGGDFYNYLEMDEDHVAIVIGDVSGKGIGSAFFMSTATMAFNYAIRSSVNKNDPAMILMNVNDYLLMNDAEGLFATCWLGIYEVSTRKLTFANAGHNYPVIIKKDKEPELLKSKVGLVLAGMENSKYSNIETILDEGDEILLYTDGVTEAKNAIKEMFGDERLLRKLESVRNMDAESQVNEIIKDIFNFIGDIEQFDDITMLAMKINK